MILRTYGRYTTGIIGFRALDNFCARELMPNSPVFVRYRCPVSVHAQVVDRVPPEEGHHTVKVEEPQRDRLYEGVDEEPRDARDDIACI